MGGPGVGDGSGPSLCNESGTDPGRVEVTGDLRGGPGGV